MLNTQLNFNELQDKLNTSFSFNFSEANKKQGYRASYLEYQGKKYPITYSLNSKGQEISKPVIIDTLPNFNTEYSKFVVWENIETVPFEQNVVRYSDGQRVNTPVKVNKTTSLRLVSAPLKVKIVMEDGQHFYLSTTIGKQVLLRSFDGF